jgi:UDP:flavonoid glycosyltransferase YjiC (YdhE family)
VATAGTWQARVVERYGAGTVMRRWDAESLDEAVTDARARWEEVSAAARRAAQELASAHDPAHLVRALAGGR